MFLAPRPLLFNILEERDHVSQATRIFSEHHIWPLDWKQIQTQEKSIDLLLHFDIAKRQGQHKYIEFLSPCRKGEKHCQNIVDALSWFFVSPWPSSNNSYPA
jgi:hypothetical protein